MVLELNNISKYYGDKKILEIENLKIYENEKIEIVGQNGSGKTTLLNIISGVVKPDTGQIIRKQNVIYMEQFEDMDNENSYLSGGERVKVSIAKILVSDTNMLILDEPTNFLDIESIESLEKLLKEYEGNYSSYLQYEKEKTKQQQNHHENDTLLLEFKLSQITSELSVT